jgi:hypothetical protein
VFFNKTQKLRQFLVLAAVRSDAIDYIPIECRLLLE